MAYRTLVTRALGALMILFSCHVFANLPLNGLSVHKDLGKEQFIAALYSSTLSQDSEAILSSSTPAAMEMRVVAKRLSRRRFNRMWIEGSSINNPGSVLTAQADNMLKFTNLFKKKLVAGDHVRIDRNAEGATEVTVNNIQLGTIADPDFFPVLLRTWVGRVPLSSVFRTELMAAGNYPDSLLSRYNSINPTDGRSDAILAWKEPSTDAAAIAAPAVSAPVIAKAEPKKPKAQPKKPEVPKPQIAKIDTPVIAAPTIAQAPAPAAPVPAPAPAPQPEPPKAPVQETPAPVNDEDDDEEMEDDEDFTPMTAESLLARQTFTSTLLRYTQSKIKRYPKTALRRNQEGSVRMSVTINREGGVVDSYFVEESRFSSLNKAVKKAINKADPYPPIPVNIQGDTYSFPVVVNFKLPK